MEPRSNIRLTRTKPRFVRGVVIGDTDLTATELTNIETVANLDAEDLEALASSADVLTAIGTYEGAADIATDLAAVVSTVGNAEAGLVSDVAALEASVDTANTGLLDRTTALETTVDTAETGLLDRATALETAIGTYAGAADIATDLAAVVSTVGDEYEGVVKDVADAAADIIDLQAAAALEITEKPNPLAITVPDNTPYVKIKITADDDTIELTLPTGASNIGRLIAVTVDITGTTTLDIHTGVAEETSIPNGIYLYYCTGEGTWGSLHEIYAAYVAET